MKRITFNIAKNELLKKTRGVSFEEAIEAIQQDGALALLKNKNIKYQDQYLFVLRLKGYVYVMPFKDLGNELFLITIYPSRKYKKNYEK